MLKNEKASHNLEENVYNTYNGKNDLCPENIKNSYSLIMKRQPD